VSANFGPAPVVPNCGGILHGEWSPFLKNVSFQWKSTLTVAQTGSGQFFWGKSRGDTTGFVLSSVGQWSGGRAPHLNFHRRPSNILTRSKTGFWIMKIKTVLFILLVDLQAPIGGRPRLFYHGCEQSRHEPLCNQHCARRLQRIEDGDFFPFRLHWQGQPRRRKPRKLAMGKERSMSSENRSINP